jgi:DNA-binding response OmpR family regulator
MPEMGEGAAVKPAARPSTTFPTVPIAEVPFPAEPRHAKAFRPIVLVVNDEPIIADTLAEILSQSGYAAMAAYDEKTALETAALVPPDLLISDVLLPQMSGVDLAIAVKSEAPDCKVILLAEQPSASELLAAADLERLRISLLNKPIRPVDLLSKVTETLDS